MVLLYHIYKISLVATFHTVDTDTCLLSGVILYQNCWMLLSIFRTKCVEVEQCNHMVVMAKVSTSSQCQFLAMTVKKTG